MTLIFTVLLVALVFEYINGFHDTANSIATVVSTKVLTPRQAVVMAAATNLVGALWGTAVAKTIASGLVDGKIVGNRRVDQSGLCVDDVRRHGGGRLAHHPHARPQNGEAPSRERLRRRGHGGVGVAGGGALRHAGFDHA